MTMGAPNTRIPRTQAPLVRLRMTLLLLPLATAKLLSLFQYEFTLHPVPAAAQSVVDFDQARHADGRNGANLGEDVGGDFVVDEIGRASCRERVGRGTGWVA